MTPLFQILTSTRQSAGISLITPGQFAQERRLASGCHPREIEEFLYRHPTIAEVQVFGIPDEKYGEAVCAFVVARPDQSTTAEVLHQFCSGQIAHFKIPQQFRFRESLPMTVTGKPQKFVMQEEMLRELNDSQS